MISIISPLPRDSWGRWNNLDNATNLNGIWQDLNLPADSRLSEYKSREGLHFALYVVSESPETGVLVRLGLAQYKFTLLGWSCDGFENYLTLRSRNVIPISFTPLCRHLDWNMQRIRLRNNR